MPKLASELVANEVWAIQAEALKTVLSIAGRNLSDLEAVEKIREQRLARSERAVNRDGVAILNITGPIFRHANMFTEISGATSIDLLARDLNVALEDPNIEAILLNLDTPGGVVNGTHEFANMIKAASKPVTAYVGHQAASAGYWIASAADEIVIDATASLGSIGVVQAIEPSSGKTLEIVSSQSPKKRVDIETDDGRAVVQQRVDDVAGVFVATVAKNRDVSPETVISDFGGGDVLVGRKAVDAGMADRLGSYEEVLAGLAGKKKGGNTFVVASHSQVKKERVSMPPETQSEDPQTPQVQGLTVEAVASDYPDIAQHFRAEGATAERDRIIGIEQAALPGHDDLVAQFKADGTTSAGDAALAIVAAEKKKTASHLDRIRASSTDANNVAVDMTETGSEADGGTVASENLTVEEQAQLAWDKDPKVRDEFGKYSTFLAYQKAHADGRVWLKEKA